MDRTFGRAQPDGPFSDFPVIADLADDLRSDDMFGGNSKPPIADGKVTIVMTEQAWKGFFWYSNFYGALVLFAMAGFCLYFFWDRVSKQDKLTKTGIKVSAAIIVASGVPLKFIYRHLMIMPLADKVDIKALQIFDLTKLAEASYFQLEGPWFLTKVIVLCPIGYAITLLLYHRQKHQNIKSGSSA